MINLNGSERYIKSSEVSTEEINKSLLRHFI